MIMANQSEIPLVEFHYIESKDGKWKCKFHDPHGTGEMSGEHIDDHSKIFIHRELSHQLAIQSGLDFPFVINETKYETKWRWFKKYSYRTGHTFEVFNKEDLKEFFRKIYDPQQFYSVFTLAMHPIADLKRLNDQYLKAQELESININKK